LFKQTAVNSEVDSHIKESFHFSFCVVKSVDDSFRELVSILAEDSIKLPFSASASQVHW
jgi:hypothetical protein